MKKSKKKQIILFISILCLFIGGSFAYWMMVSTQTDYNIASSKCFKVSIINEGEAINLPKAYPITDEEGLQTTGYSFTIQNTCNTYASYQVNLEDLLDSSITKRLSNKYVKVSLNDSTPKVLNTYNKVSTTIDDADASFKLTSGSLAPTGDSGDSVTYTLKLWMDYDTPTLDETMNAMFKAQISVTTAYASDDDSKITNYITTLASTDTTNLATDDYGNTRYIGSNPNNYVSFDGDIWRIIGVMKNVDDGNGNKEDRVKIIRSTSIGSYAWNVGLVSGSSEALNSGNGVNEWSQADLMNLLNSGYYWRSSAGECYTQQIFTDVCNFINSGIKQKLIKMISNAVWNTGAIANTEKNINEFYNNERSTNTGKICTSGTNCTDTVTRTTTWTGKVGLMYPSDYGYATSGGVTTTRTTCLNTSLSSWSSNSDCENNDWLYTQGEEWTITPVSNYYRADFVTIISNGISTIFPAAYGMEVRPVTYLLSSVKVQSGDGSSENPYILTN